MKVKFSYLCPIIRKTWSDFFVKSIKWAFRAKVKLSFFIMTLEIFNTSG